MIIQVTVANTVDWFELYSNTITVTYFGLVRFVLHTVAVV